MHGLVETVCIRTTLKCNLSCQHCWADSSPQTDTHLSSAEIIAFCKLHASAGLRHVSLSGGEPALYPAITDLVRELSQIGLSVTITTNGTVSPGLSKTFQKMPDQLLSTPRLRVSIDGYRHVHDSLRGAGTFDKATQEIVRAKDIFGWVGVNTVVWNAPDSLMELCHVMACLKVDEWALMTILPRGRLRKANIDKNKTLKILSQWTDIIQTSPFRGQVTIWDYLSHPNGGVVVDTNRMVILPGVRESDDIIIGPIDKVTPELLDSIVRERIRRDPVSFFSASVDTTA